MIDNKLVDQFVEKMDLASWDQMDPEQRLSLFQEFENLMADIQGRDALKIEVIPMETIKKHEARNSIYYGNFDRKENKIFINPRFLTKRKNILGASYYNVVAGLNTVAHEGRHAWQHYVCVHPEKNLVDRNTYRSLKLNFSYYIQSNSSEKSQTLYESQLVELDARRYARDVIRSLKDSLERINGHADRLFVSEIRRCEMREQTLATKLMKHVKAKEFIEFEKMIISEMNKKNPGVDYTGASIYADAMEFLQHKDKRKFVDGKPIRSMVDQAKVRLEQIKENIKPRKSFQEKSKIKVW